MAGLIDLNGLGHFKAKENAMVADTYSASKTYAVGDYVYYNGTLYRCTTAISTTEAWTAGHWTAVKLADDCSALKTAITEVFTESPNLYDPTKNIVGLLLAANGNLYSNYPDFTTSDFIPVSEGDTVRAQFTYNQIRYDSANSNRFAFYTACFYNSSKTFISDSGANNVKTAVAPENAAYFRFSVNNNTLTSNEEIAIIISDSSTVLPYVAPDTTWYMKEQYIPESYDAHIKDVMGVGTDDIILNLPEKVYAVVGIECNIYFENITEDWTKFHWVVTCAKGKQMERCYTITPVVGDVGEYTLTIRASFDEETYKEVTSTLVITAASTGTGISVIVLGDSTTNNGIAIAKLHTDFEESSTTVSTLGTRGTAPNNHEGRAGWKFSDYFTKAVDSGDSSVVNPFYNPSTQTFDASYYFTNSGVSKPDWFFINLGINDVFGATSDTNLLANVIPTVLGYCNDMIESVLDASPSTKVGVCITIPPNDSQNAFGIDYGCAQTRDRCKRNNVLWAKALIEEYSDKESDGIYLIPIHASLDTVYNMGLEEAPVNARNATMTAYIAKSNSGVHPVESGYWQIADVYTAFLKAQAE